MNSYNFYGKGPQKNDKSRENPGRNLENRDNFNRYLKYQRAPGQYYPADYPYWYFPFCYYPQGQQAQDNCGAYPNPYCYGYPFPPYPNSNTNAENAKANAPAGNNVNAHNTDVSAAISNTNMQNTNKAAPANNANTPSNNAAMPVNSAGTLNTDLSVNANNTAAPAVSAENSNQAAAKPVPAAVTAKTEENKKTEETRTAGKKDEAAGKEQSTRQDYVVHNVVEYLNAVEIAYIQLEAGSGTNLWFRGSESDNYSLLPEVARKPYNVNVETTFMTQFKPKASPYISGYQEINLVYNDNSYIAALFLMKRFGIPTRLLSWTEDALAALFFAVSNKAWETENPVVWCLDPVKLNMTYNFGETPGYIPNAAEQKVAEIFGSGKNSGLSKPCAVFSPFLSADMVAQKETFTVFPFNDELKPLEALPDSNKYLYKITIDKSMSDTIASQLERYGFSRELLIRGLETVAEDIVSEN